MREASLIKIGSLGALFLVLIFIGCNNTATLEKNIFGIFTVNNDGLSAEVQGTIVDATLQDFNDMTTQYPNLKILNLVDVPGSDVNGDMQTDNALELGRRVYSKNINTHLADNGFVASGGTDLLASGKSVSVGTNPIIGVHSWGGGIEGNPNGSSWDIKDNENHIDHQKYLRYFEDIGFSTQKAKKFYFFTIRAASTNDIHYMTTEEINQYLIR